MKSFRLLSLILPLALTATACGSSMKTPDIKQNPHPKMRYEITMTIDGAPGVFDAVTGFVQYRVVNDQCVPLSPISGATIPPEKNVPIVFEHEDGNVYRGTIYIDLLQDGDYYGLGVCRWSVVAAIASLKIREAKLSPSIDLDGITSNRPAVRYFSNHDYVNAETNRIVIGSRSRDEYKPELRDSVFSITLKAKEDFQ
jgi:hypothetical protein